ncbi:hypothetical protein D9611_005457 [Ephemerocybe angulata]|uniref:F-box domain-containing protein n=1 Tax=Ephemerocybe angulata TaxID=980116 RepID=A0A8H5C209_9AGAR|nr:hypothetical protein D9611_005457 [Tulosesus angulatus]
MDIAKPFLHHLDTNHVPSQAEVPVIRSLLQEHQRALDTLDAQIAALTATRKARATFVQGHIALASPIKRLPDDILSCLFIALWIEEPKNGDMSPTSPGVVLSHVCRRWRQLALATPTLWSALKIHSPPLHRVCTYSYGKVSRNDAARSWEREVKRILATSCVWIERSKCCPLSLDVNLPHLGEAPYMGVKPPLNTGDLPLLVEAICDVSSRWRKAIIRLPANSSAAAAEWPYTRFAALKPEDVPLLRELAVIQAVNDLHMPPPAISPMQQGLAIIGAHSLHSLSFGPLRVPLASLSVRWDQLTSLTFNGRVIGHGVPSFGVNEALTLFRMCPRLVICDILMYITDVPDYAAHAGTIRMRYLESLTFRYAVPGRAFMRYVDLPSLHTLRLPNLVDRDHYKPYTR